MSIEPQTILPERADYLTSFFSKELNVELTLQKESLNIRETYGDWSPVFNLKLDGLCSLKFLENDQPISLRIDRAILTPSISANERERGIYFLETFEKGSDFKVSFKLQEQEILGVKLQNLGLLENSFSEMAS